jgi:hypothetical protein
VVLRWGRKGPTVAIKGKKGKCTNILPDVQTPTMEDFTWIEEALGAAEMKKMF